MLKGMLLMKQCPSVTLTKISSMIASAATLMLNGSGGLETNDGTGGEQSSEVAHSLHDAARPHESEEVTSECS